MNILLADDHTLFREGMEMIIQKVLPHAKIVCANDWQQTYHHIQNNHYDLALVDLFMPRTQTWEQALKQVLTFAPELAVCIVTASTIHSHVKITFNLGARGFIHKTSGIKDIQAALLTIQQGQYYFPSLNHKTPSHPLDSAKLSTRQKEVLALLVKGNSNKLIGSRLEISEATVKRHIYNIYQCLGTKNRVQTGKIVEEQGLLFQ